MSLTIEIVESINILEVESAIGDNYSNLEVETSTNSVLEISTEYVGNVMFASDVIGLDNFIANFIDEYNIDCGSP